VTATTSPTTTGGSAMPVLMMLKTKERQRKLLSASHVPNGKPISRLMSVASVDTCIESNVMGMISDMENKNVMRKTEDDYELRITFLWAILL
jgi:hypothetical protein